MRYEVRYSAKAMKILQKMDYYDRAYIKKWIEKNLVGCLEPRIHGKNLVGNQSGMWRYRVGNYRIIADINDEEVVILVVKIGHRRDVYE